MTKSERWLPIPGYEGLYEVSNLGRVRSVDRINSRGHRLRGRVLKPIIFSSGYLRVGLSRDGKRTLKAVHRLVLRAFHNPDAPGTWSGNRDGCPPDYECRHLNGNRQDNRLSNLLWSTHPVNQADRRRHGTHGWKLSEQDVKRIFELRKTGLTQQAIAAQFGIDRSQVSRILAGKIWKHVTG